MKRDVRLNTWLGRKLSRKIYFLFFRWNETSLYIPQIRSFYFEIPTIRIQLSCNLKDIGLRFAERERETYMYMLICPVNIVCVWREFNPLSRVFETIWGKWAARKEHGEWHFLRRSATARYRFTSSLPAINPFDAITNFRGQNALSLPLSFSPPPGFDRVWHSVKCISDAKFTQFTASRN